MNEYFVEVKVRGGRGPGFGYLSLNFNLSDIIEADTAKKAVAEMLLKTQMKHHDSDIKLVQISKV